MSNVAIVAIVFGAIAVLALAALAWTQGLGPLRHRGEEAEGHADDIDSADACALTRPLPEHVPAHPHPDLIPYERELAHINVARISDLYLTNWSTR